MQLKQLHAEDSCMVDSLVPACRQLPPKIELRTKDKDNDNAVIDIIVRQYGKSIPAHSIPMILQSGLLASLCYTPQTPLGSVLLLMPLYMQFSVVPFIAKSG